MLWPVNNFESDTTRIVRHLLSETEPDVDFYLSDIVASHNDKKILTTPEYWANCPMQTKTHWRKLASLFDDATVCTHRPNARFYRGTDRVRRCSTGGRWGKSADIVYLSIDALLQHGYSLVD
jgi:hypothetical protein